MTTEQNYQAVKSGCSALSRYEGRWNLHEPFAASLFTDEQMESIMIEGYSRFESLALSSVREALSRCSFDITSNRVLLVVSSTKANIELLADNDTEQEETYSGKAAKHIAEALGITTEPVVVCNACISGVAAQILAQRLIGAGRYDYAIVIGGEVQSKFIVSGFQAFKSVSDEPCRPFDIERLGLNLGEGAATIIMASPAVSENKGWTMEGGCIRNDAYHLSAPHPQGEGYLHALEGAMEGHTADELATVGVHGTATMYNDQMESKAIQRAGLSDIPLTALKGYYGHTLGATGVIEPILTMCATDDGIVLGAKGFEEIGVSGKVDISCQHRTTDKESFVKALSGFGGCNGAAFYSRKDSQTGISESTDIKEEHCVRINSNEIWIDGEKIQTESTGRKLLKELYKTYINDYPRFFKMDILTRLTFVASELLLKTEGQTEEPGEKRAIVLFSRSASAVADKQYYATIKDDEDCYPSPSVFLYTMPNLTTGEIAIRNHYTGETSFYILDNKDEALMADIIQSTFMDKGVESVIAGWVDSPDEEEFEAQLSIYSKQ